MPFVSVIIPNYNHARFLKERIDSVLNQTFTDFELIILDDHSKDNSRYIIEQYRSHPKISHIVYNEKNSGSSFKQWKKGIELAKSDWIWIAESDDEALPQFLQTAHQALSQNPSAGIFYCNSIYESSDNAAPFKTTADYCNTLFKSANWYSDYFAQGHQEITDFLSKHNTILNASSVILHKDTLLPIIKKISSTHYMGDWLSYLQVASKKDVVYSSKPLNKYRRHSNSVFGRNIPKWKRKRDYFIIYAFLSTLSFLQNKPSLTNFYITNHLDFGLRSDSLVNNYKTIKSYFTVKPSLALNVVTKIFLKKMKLLK